MKKYILLIALLIGAISCTSELDIDLSKTEWQQVAYANFINNDTLINTTTILFKDNNCGLIKVSREIHSTIGITYASSYINDFYYYYNNKSGRGEIYILSESFKELERVDFEISPKNDEMWYITSKNIFKRK
jgi:hypothetical protein